MSTGAGFGATDLLGLSRTAHLLQEDGLSRGVIARVTQDNAAALLEAGI